MARRRIADEPMSRLAVWARRSAFFSLVTTILAIIIVRSGLVETMPGVATLAGALLFALLGIVLAIGAFVVIWREGIRGAGRAFAAVTIGLALLVYPIYLGIRAYQRPMINDITTDFIDPPRFDVVARLRPRGTVEYAGLYTAELQREFYPDIEPLTVTASPQIAFEETIKVMTRRKWRIVVERAPQAGRRDGQIEAVARTPVMGFREDVAVRIRATPEGAIIDVRSASRYGRHDIGSNASRVRSLLEEIDEAVSVRTDQQERQRKPPPKPTPKPAPAKPGQPAKR